MQLEEENPFDFPEDMDDAAAAAVQAPPPQGPRRRLMGEQRGGLGEPAPKRSLGLPQPPPEGEAGGHFLCRTGLSLCDRVRTAQLTSEPQGWHRDCNAKLERRA